MIEKGLKHLLTIRWWRFLVHCSFQLVLLMIGKTRINLKDLINWHRKLLCYKVAMANTKAKKLIRIC